MLPYQTWLNKALRRVIYSALTHAADKGLEGSTHAFYITFKTYAPAVVIPDFLRVTYPEEMTILLQDNFFNLVVEDAFFQVTLSFQGSYHVLTIPYSSIVNFIDPSVDFGLRFDEDMKNSLKIHTLNSKPHGGVNFQTKSLKDVSVLSPDKKSEENKKGDNENKEKSHSGAKILAFKRPPKNN